MNKLALGTVQFGLDYGVTNNSGKVQIKEVRSILEFAKNNDINVLDTAARYGNSEEVLGSADVGDFQVITKTTPLKNDVNEVIDNFYKSLKNLNKDQVYGLLVHDVGDIDNEQFDLLYRKIIELKQQGLVSKIGFSTYTPEQVDFLLKNFDFDLIQVPFNVFDNRLIQGGQLKALNNKGIEIHARSVFLQGILLDFNNIPCYFSTWKKEFNDYQEVVKDRGLSLIEYALNYALNVEEIDKVLVGVNSKEQLIDIVNAAQKQATTNAFTINNLDLLNPSRWKV
jgi:aryl-alcohol dehydrogenase-like predicted oxidoreductase